MTWPVRIRDLRRLKKLGHRLHHYSQVAHFYYRQMKEWIKSQGDCVVLRLVIQPRASKSEVVGEFGSPPRLKLRIAAPPVDGAAKEAVVEFLARKLSVSKGSIEIVRGKIGKNKIVLCRSIPAEDILSASKKNRPLRLRSCFTVKSASNIATTIRLSAASTD
jgi:uncharacterized protein (TIGR00251 family)